MKKVELVKKLVLSVFVMLYDIVSLLWCYIIISNLIYAFSFVSVNENSINIIGGADSPTAMFITAMFIMEKFLVWGFSVLFVLLSISTMFLLAVSILKKQTNRKFTILLCIFLALSLIIFIIIPTQTYVITFYLLIKRLFFLKHLHIFYIILSLVVIAGNILFAVKRRRKEE